MDMTLTLYNTVTKKEKTLNLPEVALAYTLGDFCSVKDLYRNVITLEVESEFGFEWENTLDIELLNNTLLKLQNLKVKDYNRFILIWKVQEKKDLYGLINTLKFYEHIEIINKTTIDKRNIANLVNYALFGDELAWQLETQLTPNNINALIHAALRCGIIKENDTDFFICDNYVFEQSIIQSVETLEKLPFDRKAG